MRWRWNGIGADTGKTLHTLALLSAQTIAAFSHFPGVFPAKQYISNPKHRSRVSVGRASDQLIVPTPPNLLNHPPDLFLLEHRPGTLALDHFLEPLTYLTYVYRALQVQRV